MINLFSGNNPIWLASKQISSCFFWSHASTIHFGGIVSPCSLTTICYALRNWSLPNHLFNPAICNLGDLSKSYDLYIYIHTYISKDSGRGRNISLVFHRIGTKLLSSTCWIIILYLTTYHSPKQFHFFWILAIMLRIWWQFLGEITTSNMCLFWFFRECRKRKRGKILILPVKNLLEFEPKHLSSQEFKICPKYDLPYYKYIKISPFWFWICFSPSPFPRLFPNNLGTCHCLPLVAALITPLKLIIVLSSVWCEWLQGFLRLGNAQWQVTLYYTSWWLNQPLWKLYESKWESSPNREK